MTKKHALYMLPPILAVLIGSYFYFRPYMDYSTLVPAGKTEEGNYTGSSISGNYVWGGAMNLAWTELSESLIKSPIKLKTSNQNAQKLIDKLNNPVIRRGDLDEESYYIKSGLGPKTIEEINTESRAKFPDKSFSDLSTADVGDKDIISYAYFLKKVEYLTEFKEKNVTFNSVQVKGFEAATSNQKNGITVLNYKNDTNFAIKLNLKEDRDELYIVKGISNSIPELVSAINGNQHSTDTVANQDIFEMPFIHLNHHREYNELIGTAFENIGFEEYVIGKMYEDIKFDLDNKGARVENQAVIQAIFGTTSINTAPPKIRRFIMDKPFWIIMKRSSSPNPYFILHIENSELLEKI